MTQGRAAIPFALCLALALSSCRRDPGGHAPAAASASGVRSPGTLDVGAPTSGTAERCGQSPCRIFDSPSDALRTVLERKPLVLGVGEAHARKGTEALEPSVRRFTRELLPALRGTASDLVVELLLPNAACGKESKAAAEEQRVVTEKQSATTQNDYVLLANAAREAGIAPHGLRPSCEDLGQIASAGPEAITASLSVVTRLVTATLGTLVDGSGKGRLLLAYGGAMHNDARPRPGREMWSFGPAMLEKTGGRYVELDLIVPEFIEDTDVWRSLPWVKGFDPAAHAGSTRLLEPAKGSFVLVFPASR